MNYNGKCEYCGGDVFAGGEDAGSICTVCGSTWRVDGVAMNVKGSDRQPLVVGVGGVDIKAKAALAPSRVIHFSPHEV